MAHLTDMEELLSTIPAINVRDYMREAMSCYMAGAYRGAIVLSYIALFDDLLAKLGELANVNSSAKLIFVDASKKKSDQDVYESYLIDQLTSKNLISGLDSAFLTTLRTLRNKSAHPSGHKPSPEEARYIFFETVSRFLSRPILSTTQLVDEIIDRLKNANFFPSHITDDITSVVESEISNLHEEAIPQLVAKLTLSCVSTDINTSKNATYFLIGLAYYDKSSAFSAIQSKLITAKSDDQAYSDILMQLLSANGKFIIGLNTTSLNRVGSIISSKISSLTGAIGEDKLLHPARTLLSIASVMGDSEFIAVLGEKLEALFKKRVHTEFMVKLVSAKKSSFLPIYFPILLGNAGSSDFSTANTISGAIDSLDLSLGGLLDDEQAFQLIMAVIKASNYGAYKAQGVVNSSFAGIPVLREKAIQYIGSNKSSAESYVSTHYPFPKNIDEFVLSYLTDESVA